VATRNPEALHLAESIMVFLVAAAGDLLHLVPDLLYFPGADKPCELSLLLSLSSSQTTAATIQPQEPGGRSLRMAIVENHWVVDLSRYTIAQLRITARR
jgi:hypothetical protein